MDKFLIITSTARLIYTLVCVHWYDSATTDQSSELKHNDQNASLPDLVYFRDISI